MRKFCFFLLTILSFSAAGCAQHYFNLATEKEETYFYSSEKEVQLGEALSKEVSRRFKTDNDDLVQKRIREIGFKLVEVCDRKDINYYFNVLDEKEVNAFALPGGYVYIFKGLCDKIADKDDKIASVLAHEIAHITARHTVKRLQESMGYGALAILVNTASGMDAQSRLKATIGINQLLLAYSREEELEADVLAVKYLGKAGYDSKAAIEVLKILQKTQRDLPVRPQVLQTHPYINERMKTVKEEINRGAIEFNDYINSPR